MTDKLIIAIETSGRLGSVAIGRGSDLISETPFSGFMKHSAELFSVLEKQLHQAGATVHDVEKVYITAGPGSFTGLRIAVTAAKMFYFTQNTQIVAADSMDVVAENASRYAADIGQTVNSIATILDAKKNLFYAAVYDRDDGNWKKCFDTQTITAESLLDWLETNNKKAVGLLGEGLVYYAERFNSPFTFLIDEPYWSATATGLFRVCSRMAAANQFADPLALKPKYVGMPDAMAKQRRMSLPTN